MTELERLKTPNQVLDQICGMTVTPEKAAGNYTHGGETYYFCCKNCLAKFEAKFTAKLNLHWYHRS